MINQIMIFNHLFYYLLIQTKFMPLMKTVLLLALSAIAVNCFGQSDTMLTHIFPFKADKIYYTQTIKDDSGNTYDKAKKWVQLNQLQGEGNTIFNADDKLITTSKTISVPTEIPVSKNNPTLIAQWNYSFMLRIDCSTNETTIVTTNFKLTGANQDVVYNAEDFLPQIRTINNVAHLNKKWQQQFENAVYDSYQKLDIKVKALINDLMKALQS